MRGLLGRTLSDAGMRVTGFESAADLLAQADLASACVLVLDMSMPGMSGMELHQRLQERGVEWPVLFISGSADLATAVAAMRNGAADFIEKPFDAALLIEGVRRAAARRGAHAAPSQRPADPLVMARFDTLTQREREVFHLLVTGMSSKLIARELGGSFRTIEIHRAQVMRKMMALHLSDLVRMRIESMPPHPHRQEDPGAN